MITCHFEVTKKSERVIKNKENPELHVDKVPTGLKASVFSYDIQQQITKLYNPAFILILRSLKLDEQFIMRKYAKVAVQSANTEHAQQKQRSRGSTISYSASTAILSPKKPSTISSSKEDGQCKKKREGKTRRSRKRL